MTVEKVFDFIKKHGLAERGDRVLIGLSGGADSVCLTHILYTLRDRIGIELFAAHLNHGIRGSEAERDELFAKRCAEALSVPFFAEHADIKGEAKRRGVSEELCGREARYAFFERIAAANGITRIATAHNMNDNAETILMNFIRGASINGLCGIPVRRGNIIRPVLCLTRAEIESYVNKNGLEYVTDSTNLSKVYTRNKIRLDFIPKIERELNPNFTETAVKNAENINADRELLDEIADKAYRRYVSNGAVDTEALNAEHISIRRRILYKMLTEAAGTADISSQYVDTLEALASSGRSGSGADLPSGLRARVEYGRLIIGEKSIPAEEFEYTIDVGKITTIPELGIEVSLEETDIPGKMSFTFPKNAVLSVRNRRKGDLFYPEGMNGSKKLKNYFIDEKIPREKRGLTGLLTADGEIAYIIGKRRDRRFSFKDKGVKLIIKELRR